jgi:hypothetical protein
MIKDIKTKLAAFFENTGLDWLLVIVNEGRYFPYSKKPQQDRQGQIRNNLKQLGEDEIKYTVEFLKTQYQEESERQRITESKANQIIGFSAVSMSFVVAFAGLVSLGSGVNPIIRSIITLTYCLIGLSFLITVLLALRVISISTYQHPNLGAISEPSGQTLEKMRLNLAVSIQASYEYNHQVVNDKATYLLGAQLWLRNVIILLVSMVLLHAIIGFT